MAEFHFLRPYWLLTIIPAFFICLGLFRSRHEELKWAKDIDPHLLKHLLVGQEQQHWFSPVHILPVLLLLTTLSLAGPSWKKEPAPFLDDNAGLMVLLKVSSTMLATDVQPSRLTRAKQKIRDLLELREGAATGLIVYSGSAHLVMPPTRDNRILTTMLEDLSPELMPVDGDTLQQGLQLAEQLFTKSDQPGSLLIIADSVATGRNLADKQNKNMLPVQFLAVQPPSSSINAGLQDVADTLGARIIPMSIDQADVNEIARNAASNFTAINSAKEGERWHDSGYLLLPFIACLYLLWFRKGWVIP